MSSKEWKTHKLKDLCTKIGSGATPRGGKESYLDDGPFTLIRSQNVLDFSFSYDGLAFIDEEQANQLSNVELQERDVLLNITGDSVARVCQVPSALLPARVNQHVSIIRPQSSKLMPEYLKYFLLNPRFKNYMLGLASVGGTRNALTKGMIEDFEIDLPPLPTQRRIAAILSALDSKIELNRQTNATLEAIAQAIFKEWFVAFRFPGATGEMQESELGPIPQGWRVGKLEDIAVVIMGLSPSGDSYNTDGVGVPLINGPVEFGDYFPAKTKWTTTPNKMAQTGDLIFCVRGSTTGRRVVADDSYCIGRGVCVIRAKNNAEMFLYQTINFGIDNLLSKTTGSVFPSLSAPDIKCFQILLPTWPVIQQFEKLIEPIRIKIETYIHQSTTLTQIRDSLLPKLMSGEIGV